MAPAMRLGSHKCAPIEIMDDANSEEDKKIDRIQRAAGGLGRTELRDKAVAQLWAERPRLKSRADLFETIEIQDDDQAGRQPLESRAIPIEAIEIEDDDQARPAEELEAEMPFVDLTSDGPVQLPDSHQPYCATHIPTAITSRLEGERDLIEYSRPSDGLKLRRGMTVELAHNEGRFNANFLKIAAVVLTVDGDIKLRGHIYTRTRNLKGYLLRRLNEVALIANVVKDDARDWNRQAMCDFSPEDVTCVRLLRTTNAREDVYGVDRELFDKKGKEWVEEHGVLCCRWHFVLVHHNRDKLRLKRADEWLLRRVTESGADKSFAEKDAVNLAQWRGGKVPGGSVVIEEGREKYESPTVDLDPDNAKWATKPDPRPRFYSGGDMFAGAGGTSRGMVNAKIRVQFALDNWDKAAATYRRNFQNTKFYMLDAFNFLIDKNVDHRVDILHLSPPCQFYSPAHTREGRNDMQNMACLFTCGHIIEKVRPRVFTIEQTFGLIHPKHEPYFNALVGDLTRHGYSVRWKVVHFNNWGLCQKRRRLIFIGVAPGEELPDFPEDSHGAGYRRPFARVVDAVPDKETDLSIQHDVERAYARDGPTWDPAGLLPYTITCSGGGNVHWTGTRDFTVREYAWLQGFPTSHSFEGSKMDCVKQIGNAVPPNMANRLFRHLVWWLKMQDGVCEYPDRIAKSEARKALEAVKIETPPGDEDDDVICVDDRPQLGSSSELSIAISDDDDDSSTDVNSMGSDEDEDEEDVVFLDYSPPPKPEHRLRPSRRFWGRVKRDDDDARSDSSCTAVGDGDDVGVMDLDPPERMGDYSIQRRGVKNCKTEVDGEI